MPANKTPTVPPYMRAVAVYASEREAVEAAARIASFNGLSFITDHLWAGRTYRVAVASSYTGKWLVLHNLPKEAAEE